MKKYLIKSKGIGLFIMGGDNAIEAFAEWATHDEPLNRDCFITREQLLKRGITAIKTTNVENVWELEETKNE